MSVIYTKYLPATDNRGTRIRVYSKDCNGKSKSMVLPYDHSANGYENHINAIKKFVEVNKDDIYYKSNMKMYYGDVGNGLVCVCDDGFNLVDLNIDFGRK